MGDGSPVVTPPEDEGGNRRRRLFATRGQKVAAVVGGAFLATIGAAIATWAIAVGQSTTKKVLGDHHAPLTVRVLPRDALVDTLVVSPYFVVPRARVPSPTAVSAYQLQMIGENAAESTAWAERHGAVDGSPEIVNLELRGKSDEPVTVTGIKITVLARQPRVKGWFVASANGCGVQPVRLALVDLDAAVPRADYYESDSSPKAERLALYVTRTNPELIQLTARTRSALVAWKAAISYSGPDGEGSLTVDENGEPFRVSTEIGSKGYRYEGHGKVRREPYWDRGISVC